jgi:hypothetical protein
MLLPARVQATVCRRAVPAALLLLRQPGGSSRVTPTPQDRCSTLQPSAAGGPSSSRAGRRRTGSASPDERDSLASNGGAGDGPALLDIDALLADEGAMSALRSKLQAEMAEAHGRAGSSAGSAPGGGRVNSSSSRSNISSSSRAFDSDEYDYLALSTVADAGGSVDEMAQNAADRLAHESADIAQHIAHEHGRDHILDGQLPRAAGRQSGGSSSSKRSSGNASEARGASFAGVKLPSFAAGGQQQLQQQRGGRGARNDSRNDRRNDGRNSSSSSSSRAGDPSSGGGGSDSGSSRGGGSGGGSRPLQGDTTIGRVAEAKGGVPVAVLKQGKARLFESGSPMVYGGAVDFVIGRPPPVAGDVVVVADHTLRPIAWGVFNPHSMFRVRCVRWHCSCVRWHCSCAPDQQL